MTTSHLVTAPSFSPQSAPTMPTEQVVAAPPPLEPHPVPPQIKVCATCHGPMSDSSDIVFLGSPNTTDRLSTPGPVCVGCYERSQLVTERVVFGEQIPRLRRQSTLAPMVEEPTEYDTPDQSPPPSMHSESRMDLSVAIPSQSFDSHSVPSRHSVRTPDSPPHRDTRQRPVVSEPDPFADVTRLRLNNTRQDCLYPGASFVGIQKSGRNSYNVSVTIVVRLPHLADPRFLTICPERRLSGFDSVRLPHHRKPHRRPPPAHHLL